MPEKLIEIRLPELRGVLSGTGILNSKFLSLFPFDFLLSPSILHGSPQQIHRDLAPQVLCQSLLQTITHALLATRV